MSGAPLPAGVDPWSAPPGPGFGFVDTQAMRTPVMSTGASPGWQGAATPGFGRAASGAVELPFSQREAIARQFRTEDALLLADLALRTGGAEAFGWSAAQRREVLDDLNRLHYSARMNSSAFAAMADVDWRALAALARFLGVLPPSP